MDPFIAQLASLCTEHVTRSKWVFVPSHAIGRTYGERIALGGTNWLNLRFVTPLDIALRMGAPFLVERGVEPSEEGLGPTLIMRLLLDLSASAHEGFGATGSGGYFRSLADQPTMAQALWSTIRELRMAGIASDDFEEAVPEPEERVLSADSPTGPRRQEHLSREWRHPREVLKPLAAKHAELRALLASYERFLAENNRGDMAAVYTEAMKHPDWCPIQPQDCWTELPDHIWSPLQRRLIDVMPGERIAPQALELPGVTMPRRLAGDHVARIAPGAETTPLAFLLSIDSGQSCRRSAPVADPPALESARRDPAGARPDARVTGEDPAAGSPARRSGESAQDLRQTDRLVTAKGPARARSIDLFHAGGREAEIEEVLRRILQSRVPLDQVEIACASGAHVALVWEKALRHEWPVTLGPGIPAASTRPGRALIGFCDWIETDFSAGHLRHLLQSGDMGIEKDDEGFTAGQAARTIARAEAGWGRATYGLALGALRKSHESRASDPDLSDEEREAAQEKVALTKAVKDWIVKLVASIPEPSADGLVPLQAVVDAAMAFIERSTSRSSQLDHRAGAALGEHVAELRALGDFSCPLAGALRFIRERVKSLSVAPERQRPGHLYACSLAQAGYSGRPVTFVVGLEEGRVFPTATEDAVLLDDERAAISSELRLSTDRIDESVYAVLSRLAVCGERRAYAPAALDPRSPITDHDSAPDPRSPIPDHRSPHHHPLLLHPRHPRVPRDLRLLADAAGLPPPAGGRDVVLSPDEGCARRARVVGPGQPRACRRVRRLVAALRRVHGRQGQVRGGGDVREPGRRTQGRRSARLGTLHRVRRPCSGRRQGARSRWRRSVLLGHRAGGGGGLSVPVLPQARSQYSHAVTLLGQHADWPGHEATELPYLQAEEDRLLYVAATRARELLVVSRAANGKGNTAWGVLNDSLADAQELPIPKPASVRAPEPLDSSTTAQATAVAAMATAHEAVRQPSWSITSVTAEAHHIARMTRAAEPTGPDDATKVVVASTQSHRADAGMAWGTLIHGLLEHAMRHPSATREDLRRLAMWLTVEEPQLREVIENAIAVAQQVAVAPFWAEAQAGEHHEEAPFCVAQGDRALSSGVIDLLFATAEAWRVRDYKTDVSLQPEKYEQQLNSYRAALKTFGYNVEDIFAVKVRPSTEEQRSALSAPRETA